jgi:hypothetical protein
VRALAVAAPVLERLEDPAASWRLVGSGASTAYVGSDDFVIAITTPGVPLMPNGIAIDQAPLQWPPVGAPVRCEPGVIELWHRQVLWDAGDPPVWRCTPSTTALADDLPALRQRGAAVLRACGIRPGPDLPALAEALWAANLRIMDDKGGHRGVLHLLSALAHRDAGAAGAAVGALLGRGPGLTPEGDDLLSGAASVVARFGAAAGFAGSDGSAAWLAAMCPADAHERSRDLSVTLLALAAAGSVVEPADRVLDLTERNWRSSLLRLRGIGGSTGLAYSLAIGATAWLLGSPARGA